MNKPGKVGNWSNLIGLFGHHFRKLSMHQSKLLNKHNVPAHLLSDVKQCLMKIRMVTHVHYHKIRIKPSNLNLRQKQVYNYILHYCETEEQLLKIHDVANGGTKYSGRTIDTLTNKASEFGDVSYYIDLTSGKPRISETFTSNSILFDVAASYRVEMHRLTKSYFDCFGRGPEVAHTLSTGRVINLSLCQIPFFMWAVKFLVLDFLDLIEDRVVAIRQFSQKNTASRPVSKKRNHRMLCVTPPQSLVKYDQMVHLRGERSSKPKHKKQRKTKQRTILNLISAKVAIQ